MKLNFFQMLALMGPGIAVAATGVGAGDMISATNAGANFGTVLLWALVWGAVLKFALNEGVGRWQLATGTTLLEGWVERLGRPVQYFFLLYLLIWSFLVGGGLLSASGIAGHTVFPGLSVAQWGIIHALAACVMVWAGRFGFFLTVMKVLVGLMFVSFLISAWALRPDIGDILRGIALPSAPSGSVVAVLSVLGGVGGSLSVMCYGYWIREAGREGGEWLKGIRIDLGGAYILTGFFGIAVMILGAQIRPEAVGIDIVLGMADRLEMALGPFGRWSLYLGFWAAVITSVLGVWQGIPYLFADFMALFKNASREAREAMVRTDSRYYRGFLLFLTFPTMTLLLFDRPVSIVIIYTVVGAFFMPFLAGTLLYMNSKRAWVGDLKTGWLLNVLLVLALVLFLYLGVNQLIDALG
ncbi:MAG: divalent metal cation transporter [Gemmatimonadetes bacterium]|nr:divalent metal cation transporter [Gemmatimonadota bacterium]MYH20520.1 divalent metal cation transporter [Gemmatimonadota bacterium]